MNETITLSNAMNIIKSGATFDIEYCSFDEKRNKGGDKISLKNCRILSVKNEFNKNKSFDNNSISKMPNHWINDTINIMLANSEVSKIHVHLIEKLNKYEIVL